MPDLSVKVKDGIRLIRFERPRRKNAITLDVYDQLTKTVTEGSTDPDTKLIVITGSGDFFTSGQDLSVYSTLDENLTIRDALNYYRNFIRSLIDCEKPVIAIVNGPAVGIGVTLLTLCDAVFASDNATFRTPFVSLALAPEGCSSYLFPRVMGYPQAGNILMFNEEITAEQAMIAGIVTLVFPKAQLEEKAWEKIRKWVQLPPQAMRSAKKIMRERDRAMLHLVNDNEYELLASQTTNEECAEAVLKFFSEKSKL